MRVLLAVLLVLSTLSWSHAQEESGEALDAVPPPPGAQPAPTAPTTTQTNPNVTPAPAAPSSDAVPPPPPGYGSSGTVQQPYGPMVQLQRPPPMDPAIAAEITRLQAERDQLGIGGRIALMAAGFGGAIGAALGAAEFAYQEELDTGCSRCGNNPGTITFGVLSVAIFSLGIVGLVLFIRRLRERKGISRQIRELRTRGMQRQVALLEW